MGNTNIEYATKVCNPVTGCTPISAGCDNCWAQAYLRRWKKPLGVTLHPKRLDEPLGWHEPEVVFVCSHGDLFHDDVPFEFVDKIGCAMDLARQHTYLILTKRPDRMRDYILHYRPDEPRPEVPPPNIYLGVSVEDQATADDRIPKLLSIPAAHHWVSIEPMIGPVDIQDILDGCPEQDQEYGDWYQTIQPPDWVVVGCESGPGARPCSPVWVTDIIDQCTAARVPLFIKQFRDSGHLVKMPKIRGKVWAETPWGKQ